MSRYTRLTDCMLPQACFLRLMEVSIPAAAKFLDVAGFWVLHDHKPSDVEGL